MAHVTLTFVTMVVTTSSPSPPFEFWFQLKALPCYFQHFQMTHVILIYVTMVVSASMMPMEMLTACVHLIGLVVSGVVSPEIHAAMVRCDVI